MRRRHSLRSKCILEEKANDRRPREQLGQIDKKYPSQHRGFAKDNLQSQLRVVVFLCRLSKAHLTSSDKYLSKMMLIPTPGAHSTHQLALICCAYCW